jgi:hypothetical protein
MTAIDPKLAFSSVRFGKVCTFRDENGMYGAIRSIGSLAQ